MKKRAGFTLIELSVVIVILSLITISILTSRLMVNNASQRVIISEYHLYTGAFKEFIDKYQAIPGDMNNATTLWGADTVCPTISTNSVPKVATCNGNGTGTIGDWTNAVATDGYEWFRAWQQLANAGLIEGRYTGAMGATSTTTTIGMNVPASKTGIGGWTLMWMKSTTDNNFFFSTVPVASHTLIYGAQTTSSFTDTGNLTPPDARSIDEKTDDGMPFTGNVRAKRADATTCAASSATTSKYLLTSTTAACQLMFILGM